MKCRCQQDNPSAAKFCLECWAPLDAAAATGGFYAELQAVGRGQHDLRIMAGCGGVHPWNHDREDRRSYDREHRSNQEERPGVRPHRPKRDDDEQERQIEKVREGREVLAARRLKLPGYRSLLERDLQGEARPAQRFIFVPGDESS